MLELEKRWLRCVPRRQTPRPRQSYTACSYVITRVAQSRTFCFKALSEARFPLCDHRFCVTKTLLCCARWDLLREYLCHFQSFRNFEFYQFIVYPPRKLRYFSHGGQLLSVEGEINAVEVQTLLPSDLAAIFSQLPASVHARRAAFSNCALLESSHHKSQHKWHVTVRYWIPFVAASMHATTSLFSMKKERATEYTIFVVWKKALRKGPKLLGPKGRLPKTRLVTKILFF